MSITELLISIAILVSALVSGVIFLNTLYNGGPFVTGSEIRKQLDEQEYDNYN